MADTPMLTDPADAPIRAVMDAMRAAFTPDSSNPPVGGGSDVVRLFAADGVPLYAFLPHREGTDCAEPFLWVRLVSRYRTDPPPAPVVRASSCSLPVGITVEAGVGRCAAMDLEPSWEDYAREAEVSMDDSWRVELALCMASGTVARDSTAKASAIDVIVPVGPEGGIFAWTGTIHFQL